MATKNAALRDKMANDFAALWNSGSLEIQESDNTVLVSFTLGADAFGDASTGAVAASGVPIAGTAAATGTADHAVLKSTGAGTYQITALTVGTSGAQVNIDNLSINSGQTVNLTAFTWTESATVS